ncbi:MAG: hypothetical protein ACI8RZ_003834 [Myxococcota bacterium]|jgi:hypothetical protein
MLAVLLSLSADAAGYTAYIEDALEGVWHREVPEGIVVVGVYGDAIWADWSTTEATRDSRLRPMSQTPGSMNSEWVCPKRVTRATTPAAAAPTVTTPAPRSSRSSRSSKSSRRGTDASQARYLYSPSAFSLKQGSGYISQKELVVTSMAYGITDHWDVQLGTFLPTLFIPKGQIAILGTRLSISAGDGVHLAGGVQATYVLEEVGGLAFTTMTLGDADTHFTANVAMPFALGGGLGDRPIVTLSGLHRYRDDRALLTEIWVVPALSGVQLVVPSAAVRFIGEKFSVDLGTVLLTVQYIIPLPWLDFTWRFGS